jgi:transcriptional regulator with XRE-family HTH domain
MSELKDRLKEALTESGKTRPQLARETKVSQTSISKWLSGDVRELKHDVCRRVAKCLNVDPQWLNYGEGFKRPDPIAQLKLDRQHYEEAVRLMDEGLQRLNEMADRYRAYALPEVDAFARALQRGELDEWLRKQ